LLLKTVGGRKPFFLTRKDHTALGAFGMFPTSTEQECLDVCVRDSKCVGVDVRYNVNAKLCRLHNDRRDYQDHNVYRELGTNSHELILRCAPAG